MRMKTTTKSVLIVLAAAFLFSLPGFAQTPVPAAPGAAPPAAAPAPAPGMSAAGALTDVAAPAADARVNGDPDGSLTGTSSDVTVADSKKGMTISDLANQAGQNKIAINFMWTLVTGFLVMFMQAGFAI